MQKRSAMHFKTLFKTGPVAIKSMAREVREMTESLEDRKRLQEVLEDLFGTDYQKVSSAQVAKTMRNLDAARCPHCKQMRVGMIFRGTKVVLCEECQRASAIWHKG